MDRTEKLNFLINLINKKYSKTVLITEDTVLSNIGLDSLDIVELQLDYEEYTKTTISETDQIPLTIKDLINLMQ